jgi:phosphoribosylformylglycinamidine (FGAM) synthase-like enzyme
MSCHDVSDGGFVTTISEMILGGNADGKIGAELDIGFSKLSPEKILFGEGSGFIMEVNPSNVDDLKKIFKFYGIELVEIGKTIGSSLIISNGKKKLVDLPIKKIKQAWTTGFVEAFK